MRTPQHAHDSADRPIDRFGASGKAADLFDHYGITTAHVTRALESLLAS